MTVRRGLWLGVWSLVVPVVFYFLLVIFFGLDRLDLSSTGGNTILVVAAGILAGLIVGFGFGLRDWRMLIPPLATGIIGLAHYPVLEAIGDNVTLGYMLIWIAQGVVMFASTWLSLPKRPASPSQVDDTDKPEVSLRP